MSCDGAIVNDRNVLGNGMTSQYVDILHTNSRTDLGFRDETHNLPEFVVDLEVRMMRK